MFLSIVLLVGGLVVVTFAADRFVVGAARLSTALRISPVIVGVVVIGFGTSSPEFLVSALASAEGAQDIAFGNIVGSNIANVLLVLGAASVIAPLAATGKVLRREVPLMLAAVAVLVAVTFDGRATTLGGVILLVAGVVVAGVLVWSVKSDREAEAHVLEELEELEGREPPRLGASLVLALIGLLGTLAGAQMIVTGATRVATELGISQVVIGVTIVAVGTSLPELVTAVAAARRKQTELTVGNVLGSNIFNSLPVGGIAAVFGGGQLDDAYGTALVVMVVSCLVASLFLMMGRRINRIEGVILLLMFVAAMWITSV